MKIKYSFIVFFMITIALISCKTAEKGKSSKSKNEKNQNISAHSNADNSAVFIDANNQKMLGNYTEAAKLYEKCLEINPNDDASLYELAKINLMENRVEEALYQISRATEIDPYNNYYLVLYANVLQSFEKYDEAAKVYEQLIELNPLNLDFYNKLAVTYLYDGKAMNAVKVYDDLEQKIGITEEFSMKKQSIYLQEKKVDKAVMEIENLIDQYPAESKYYAVLAEMCLAHGMNEKAEEAYNKIAEIDPDNPYIHISLADFYRKNGNEEKAFEELKIGFANPNLDIDSKIQILITYYTVTEIYEDLKDQAFELSEILIETHPDDPKVYSMYGDFLYQDKQLEESRNAFRKVISLDSSKYLVWEQLLFVESELDDTDAILKESKQTIELFPEQPLPYLFAGGAYYQKKEWEECVSVLNKGLYFVVNNIPMEAQFYAYLGDAYNQLRDDPKSDEAYDNVLKLDPDNDYVLNNYAYYLSLRNENLEKAAEMAKRATELRPNSPANQDTYGWVLYKMGNYTEAEIWIGKSIANEEEASGVLLEHYGDVKWQLGDTEKAYEYWLKAKEKGEGSELLDQKVEEKKLIE
ncbi:MAG: tetratricopeptide repeat protein [Bacteroidales bacterium]|nr:tetratricopeptide repeat protein [Bacteroidales bacterium]